MLKEHVGTEKYPKTYIMTALSKKKKKKKSTPTREALVGI